MNPVRDRAIAAFERTFGTSPSYLAWGPGRVNLIGEHTDYNDGFVLPMALDRRAYVAFTPRDDGVVRLRADDLDQEGSFDLADVVNRDPAGGRSGWLDYPMATAWSLAQEPQLGDLTGFDGVLSSDVPRGAGLSSSAAVELAVAAALLRPHESEMWDVKRVAKAAKRAENEWIGVASGIMDQLVGASALPGCALLIDCRDLTFDAVPLPPGVAVAILDTGTRRTLAGSAYNDRRAACERAAKALGVASLRDASVRGLESAAGDLDEKDAARARHVITEIGRTLDAADALRTADAVTFGRLMNESHASLRDLYEVSSPALDAMVEAARSAPGCLGARMTGAGFGGCAVALVEEAWVTEFTQATRTAYDRITGNAGSVYVSAAGPGAGSAAL